MDIIINMTEARYNNTQIERMFDEQNRFRDQQSDDLKEHMELLIAPLLKQVTKTNGRLSMAEKLIWLAVGALPVVAGVLIFLAKDYMDFKENFREEIHSAVESSIDNYRFQVID